MRLDSVANVLNTDSFPFEYAVKLYSTDKVQSYNNAGLMTNPATGNTFFEIGDLDTDIFFTQDTLAVGEISGPIKFTDPRGETLFRIIKVQSRTDPHIASLEKDYSKIQKAAINEKKNLFLNDWVSSKIGATYIQINSNYESCPNLEKWRNEPIRP